MPSIVVVEDHLLLAEMLCATLAARGVDAVAVEPAETEVLLRELVRLDPLLVLLDLDLGEYGDSTGLIAPLAAHGTRCLVVTGATERERLALAFEAGAFGFHPKAAGIDALVATTLTALNSTVPLDEPLRVALGTELARLRQQRSAAFDPFRRLTAREHDTLLALSNGLSVHDIAAEWVVSETTVRSHVRAVLTKLQVNSQIAAVALALRSGWLATAG
jgi:two-component system nitrate/nitrite response regulator NarL